MRVAVKKRGLSPVIASVLMILLVLVLSVIIFLWARGFIGEQVEKFGKPAEELCSSVDFSVVAIDNGGYHILEIVNRGNVGISAFEIKMYSSGDSEISKINVGIRAGESLTAEVSLGVMKNNKLADKIEIFPVLNGVVKGESSKKMFTCNKDSVFLSDF